MSSGTTLRAVPPPLLPEADKPAPGLRRAVQHRRSPQEHPRAIALRSRSPEEWLLQHATPQAQDGFVRLRK